MSRRGMMGGKSSVPPEPPTEEIVFHAPLDVMNTLQDTISGQTGTGNVVWDFAKGMYKFANSSSLINAAVWNGLSLNLINKSCAFEADIELISGTFVMFNAGQATGTSNPHGINVSGRAISHTGAGANGFNLSIGVLAHCRVEFDVENDIARLYKNGALLSTLTMEDIYGPPYWLPLWMQSISVGANWYTSSHTGSVYMKNFKISLL